MNSLRDDAPVHLRSRRKAFLTAFTVALAIALLVTGAIALGKYLAAPAPLSRAALHDEFRGAGPMMMPTSEHLKIAGPVVAGALAAAIGVLVACYAAWWLLTAPV